MLLFFIVGAVLAAVSQAKVTAFRETTFADCFLVVDVFAVAVDAFTVVHPAGTLSFDLPFVIASFELQLIFFFPVAWHGASVLVHNFSRRTTLIDVMA